MARQRSHAPGPAPKDWPPMHPQSKQCAQCGATFHPTPGRSRAQWERQQFCKTDCANTWRAQQQRPLASTQHAWATAWERHRTLEDRADLARWHRRQRTIRRATQLLGSPRLFVAGYCQACGDAWVYYAKRAQSPYCAKCNHAHHRRPANRRARQRGAKYEVIVPTRVFERDDWRCQICRRKTHGAFPHPRAPTLDHIIPLAKGGDHLYSNVQCACFECNWTKADGSANDQLRLIA